MHGKTFIDQQNCHEALKMQYVIFTAGRQQLFSVSSVTGPLKNVTEIYLLRGTSCEYFLERRPASEKLAK